MMWMWTRLSRCEGALAALLACLLGLVLNSSATPESDEGFVREAQYCTSESFEGRCPRGRIMLLEKALYGRMREGRCVTAKYNHAMGCYSDVKSVLDNRCSGRQNCSYPVALFDSIAQPCAKDFKSYLEASYRCVLVSHANACVQKNRTDLHQSHGYISLSYSSARPRTACPWVIQSDPGRRITFKVLNFALTLPSGNGAADAELHKAYLCRTRIRFNDGTSSSTISFCDHKKVTEDDIFSSHGNRVKVDLISGDGGGGGGGSSVRAPFNLKPVILYFEVYGCKDIQPPDGAFVTRQKENVVVVCNETQETWFLTCRAGTWIGDLGNCTRVPEILANPTLPAVRREFQNGIIVAVLIGVVLGILVGGFMLCVIYILRKSRRTTRRNRARPTDVQYETRLRRVDSTGSSSYPALLNQDKQLTGQPCDYEHVWNMAPPPPILCSEGPYTLNRYQPNRPLCAGDLNAKRNSDFERICLTRIKAHDTSPSNTYPDPQQYFELKARSEATTLPARTDEVRVTIRDTVNPL